MMYYNLDNVVYVRVSEDVTVTQEEKGKKVKYYDLYIIFKNGKDEVIAVKEDSKQELLREIECRRIQREERTPA